MASRKNFPSQIEKRKNSATERQTAANKLTTTEKLAKLSSNSGKEFQKLTARLAKEKANV